MQDSSHPPSLYELWRGKSYRSSFMMIKGSEVSARRAGRTLAIITASASVIGAAIQIHGDTGSFVGVMLATHWATTAWPTAC